MVHLLDANVLIALGDRDHVHHTAARHWFERQGSQGFATCPITQGALVRLLLQRGFPARGGALEILRTFVAHPAHHFWPDELGYQDIRWDGVMGHRQVTDAYLAALARRRQGRLATLDKGLAALHPDVAELLSTRTIPAG
jgi:hypothetical protein